MQASILRTATARALVKSRPRQLALPYRQAELFRRALSTPSTAPESGRTVRLLPRDRYPCAQKLNASELSQPPPPPPPSQPELSRWRRFLQHVGRFTLVTVFAAGGGVLLCHPEGSTPRASAAPRSYEEDSCRVGQWVGVGQFPEVSGHGRLQCAIRYLTRHKERQITVIEAEAKSVDPVAKTVTFAGKSCISSFDDIISTTSLITFDICADETEIQGEVSSTTIPYDYLIYGVGAETQTFGIPGVKENALFMKEIQDAERMKRRFMDCIESSGFPGQSDEEIDRLLHMVVVGGGPTGVEVSGELHDFLEDDLKSWYPELSSRIRITLVEALPSVLPMFSKRMIEYTESTFKESKIDILTKTMVKEIKEKSVVLQMPDKSIKEVPVGMVVWAGGNKARSISVDLMNKLSSAQTNRRGITVDENLRMAGTDGSIYAFGDCTASSYAPTAQVAQQQGAYVARIFAQLAKRDRIREELATAEGKEAEWLQKQLARFDKTRPFSYSHQGSLAYIGSDKAIADLVVFNQKFASSGVATYLFWRSAYLSTLFSLRNRVLVANDWLKVKIFGRDLARD
ncbi:hypothetical protein EW146_g4320 [Bondarzewia mesenterica]|uniref:NADH:ubiquinone reductase (non-electrogenic) n=1 Tax=Bondarzewia mesenterica TaxID=1095465 RepID=A0A4S4LUW2_9AGAM|nr:hypothetical protein EW146_g4320 [Bondarzewia mesenterica]